MKISTYLVLLLLLTCPHTIFASTPDSTHEVSQSFSQAWDGDWHSLNYKSAVSPAHVTSDLEVVAHQLKGFYITDFDHAITDTVFAGIILPQLKFLEIKWAEITGPTLAHILSNAPELRRLCIEGSISENLDAAFDNLPAGSLQLLTNVDLSFCRGLTPDGLAKLQTAAPNIMKLNLKNTHVTAGDFIVECLRVRATKLTHLVIDSAKLPMSGRSMLASFPCLAEVEIWQDWEKHADETINIEELRSSVKRVREEDTDQGPPAKRSNHLQSAII